MFDSSPENLIEMRSSVRKLCERSIPKFQTEQLYNTVPRDLFGEFAQLGITGLAIPEEFGGIGATPSIIAAVMEEVARVDIGPAIFLSVHTMVSGLINKFGNQSQKKHLLPRMASGEWLGAYALTEPSAGSDAAMLKTTAQMKGDGSAILNGEKCYITSAGWAEVYLVFARTGSNPGKDGISAFIIETTPKKPHPGFRIQSPEKKMGCDLSPIASLSFENLQLPKEALLGDLGNGYKIALGGLANGRINIAACANGIACKAIELSLAHLKERKQFGSALIEFQGLQFMLADMQIKLEASRSVVREAVTELERDPASRKNRLLPSIAKCLATDSAMAITTDAVQLLGGAGYLKDYQVEKLMRDAKVLQILEGTNQIQRLVIAREMTREQA